MNVLRGDTPTSAADVGRLWVSSIAVTAVQRDWSTGYPDEWDSRSAPECEGCGSYASWDDGRSVNACVDAEAADTFWRLAATGEGLPGGSPILAYRRWAISRLSSRDKPSPETWLMYNLKAMATWKSGKTLRLLAVKPEEGMPEPWS